MKMPKLQQAVGELFPDSEVLSGISPDEVIATGAARQGSYLARPFDPDCEHLAIEVPAVSKPICIKVSLNMEHVISAFELLSLQEINKMNAYDLIMSAFLHILSSELLNRF